jgi:hypothetical protein
LTLVNKIALGHGAVHKTHLCTATMQPHFAAPVAPWSRTLSTIGKLVDSGSGGLTDAPPARVAEQSD